MKLYSITVGILFSCNAMAYGLWTTDTSQDHPWYVIASVGNGRYQVESPDNENALGRLAVGNELMLTGDYALGLELGLQNGNHLDLSIPAQTLALLQWTPVRTKISPMLDLLLTAKSDPLGNTPFYAQLKGGISYRYWDVKRLQFNALNSLAGEVQAGFGYPLTTLADLSLLYQGVYSSYPNFTLNPITLVGHLSSIPTLHAVLVGLTFNL